MGTIVGPVGTGFAAAVTPPGQALTEQDVAAGVIPRFHAVVRAHPHAVAAVDGGRRVTFAGLARQAALIRAAIRATPGDGAVGLLHSHDSGAVGALLGVLSSGRPLVVLDPAAPTPRLRLLLSRTRAGVCVTDGTHAGAAAAAAARTVVTDRLVPAADTLDQFWSAPPDPRRPAVLAFTSGTTGRPKIVTNNHRMLVRDAWSNAVATNSYGPGDVVAHALPIAFHAGLMALVAGVLAGATLRFPDVPARPSTDAAAGLAAWLHASGATVAHLSPASVRALVASRPDPGLLGSLRSVTVAGEPFYAHDFRALQELLPPGCVVHHRYGSSETGLIASEALPAGAGARDPGEGYGIGHGALTVGHAVRGRRIDLIGPDGAPAPDGLPGIVTVTGTDLGSGYWDDPAATAAAFSTNPDGTTTFRTSDLGRLDQAGRLHLFGRADFSVKVGEYLVEPGEIDAVLSELPGVSEAVTLGLTPPNGSARLVAYVVARPGSAPSAGDLQAGLAAVLPPHMVPATVIFVAALPRTERGKIDRAALPEPPAP